MGDDSRSRCYWSVVPRRRDLTRNLDRARIVGSPRCRAGSAVTASLALDHVSANPLGRIRKLADAGIDRPLGYVQVDTFWVSGIRRALWFKSTITPLDSELGLLFHGLKLLIALGW